MINIKNTLFFVLYLVFNPRLLQGILKGIYLPTLIQYEWLKKFNIKTFIDVGSYKGEDSKTMNFLFPKVKIIAFEPDLGNFNYIQKKIKIKNFEIFKLALSNREGRTVFHSHPLSFLSSELTVLYQNQDRDYFNKKTENYQVETTTLDIFFRNRKLTGKVLLKIDTQGTEGNVIKGAEKLLKIVDIIHIETPFKLIYKNQTSFDEIYKILTKHGFKFIGEAKESQFYPVFKPAVSVNSIFIKKSLKQL